MSVCVYDLTVDSPHCCMSSVHLVPRVTPPPVGMKVRVRVDKSEVYFSKFGPAESSKGCVYTSLASRHFFFVLVASAVSYYMYVHCSPVCVPMVVLAKHCCCFWCVNSRALV